MLSCGRRSKHTAAEGRGFTRIAERFAPFSPTFFEEGSRSGASRREETRRRKRWWTNGLTSARIERSMAEKPQSGTLFGVPYNFERPSLKRLVSSYWKPGDDMLVEKPFGIGYTLNRRTGARRSCWRSLT